MMFVRPNATTLAALSLSTWAGAQAAVPVAEHTDPRTTLGVVTITSDAPTSLPSAIPATMQGIDAEQIARTVNATDSEDALRYFPSLLVRKRYIGDFNHAVLSSRASGTGNSARSAVYADGILLSNFLGNGATFTPRWGLVTPEEVERVDVMYGPFSAAYPGNSVGAVVDFVTRMPARFELHAGATVAAQPFRLYDTDDTFIAHQEHLAIGDHSGAWSWWMNFTHTDSHGQPLTFPTRLASAGAAGAAGTAVTGAVSDRDRSNNRWYLLGTATEYRTLQENARLKLAYDFSPTLRASYSLGSWWNAARSRPRSYLRDAGGHPVYAGTVNIDGRSFALIPADYPLADDESGHLAHGLSIKRHTGGRWDFEVAASLYGFVRDLQRQATTAMPAAAVGGAGTITDQGGTGWGALAFRGIWRPEGLAGAHMFDFGLQQERYRLRMLKSNITGHWRVDPAGSLHSRVGGDTRMQSLFVQDSWALSPDWQAVLGARVERWTAYGGYTATANSAVAYGARTDTFVSPKLALSRRLATDTMLKAAIGRAVRMPTVNELYGATSGTLTVVNDPNLRPEKSWTGELSLESEVAGLRLRTTAFYEVVRDSLYAERTVAGGTTVTRISNVRRIATPGVELALQSAGSLLPGLELQASAIWADSRIRENSGYVAIPGDTLGRYQPRVPEWRATAQADYRFDARWTASLGLRYSGRQYSTLDNSDPNGYAYQGASPYITGDLRVRFQPAPHWHVAMGVDNLGNYQYWNFHPYPRRTLIAELRFDL